MNRTRKDRNLAEEEIQAAEQALSVLQTKVFVLKRQFHANYEIPELKKRYVGKYFALGGGVRSYCRVIKPVDAHTAQVYFCSYGCGEEGAIVGVRVIRLDILRRCEKRQFYRTLKACKIKLAWDTRGGVVE